MIDFIGRFENIEEDFASACEIIGLPPPQLPHKNHSQNKGYKNSISEQAKLLIKQYCRDDIDRFEYSF